MADRMREVITSSVPAVVDDDVYNYYNEHMDDFIVPKKYKIREIQVIDVSLADSIRNLLDKGRDFGLLAEQYTVRIGMKARKGDLGEVPAYKYPVIFTKAETMRVGEIKGPFQTEGDRWSIIKVEGIEPQKTSPLEQVSTEIEARLTADRKNAAIDSWLAKQRGDTTIETNYDLIWKTINKDKYEKS